MNLKPLFEPKTMAVIGVSLHNDLNPANVVYYKNLFRYPIEVFAVNPKAGVLKGMQCYSSVADVPGQVDIAVIAIQADRVPASLEECIKAGAKSAVIISGGFAEVGRKDLQDRVTAIAKEADFPIIGPNCIGVFVPEKVDTFFEPQERINKPYKGNIALVSQSGGMLLDMIIRFTSEGAGLSSCVSIGNKAVINEKDLLEYLAGDKNTNVIAFYIEGFNEGEGHKFMEAAKTCGKPVVVLKSGKTSQGSRAIMSHTASLAGDYAVFSSVLKQYGVVEAMGLLDLIYYSQSLSCYPRGIKGRIGIITISGGHGTLATDLALHYGLDVPALDESQQELVRVGLSPSTKNIASCHNPIDVTGSAIDSDFVESAKALSLIENIDCIVTLLLPYAPALSMDLGALLSTVKRRFNKPIIAYVPRLEKYRILIDGFEINNIPVSHSIEGCMKMAQGLMKHKAQPK
jgi:acetyltransferase